MYDNYPALQYFREWIEDQDKTPQKMRKLPIKLTNEELIGLDVVPRLGIKRLINQIKKYNPNIEYTEKLSKQFKECGGKIVSAEDLDLIIETNEIKFKLPKAYTKQVEKK